MRADLWDCCRQGKRLLPTKPRAPCFSRRKTTAPGDEAAGLGFRSEASSVAEHTQKISYSSQQQVWPMWSWVDTKQKLSVTHMSSKHSFDLLWRVMCSIEQKKRYCSEVSSTFQAYPNVVVSIALAECELPGFGESISPAFKNRLVWQRNASFQIFANSVVFSPFKIKHSISQASPIYIFQAFCFVTYQGVKYNYHSRIGTVTKAIRTQVRFLY